MHSCPHFNAAWHAPSSVRRAFKHRMLNLHPLLSTENSKWYTTRSVVRPSGVSNTYHSFMEESLPSNRRGEDSCSLQLPQRTPTRCSLLDERILRVSAWGSELQSFD